MTRALHRCCARRRARRASAGRRRGASTEDGEAGEDGTSEEGGEEGLDGEEGVGSGGLAHRNRFLEGELDAASSGRLDGLLGGVIEPVGLQAATRSEGGGARALRGKRAAHPSDRSTCPRSMRRTIVGCVGARMRWGSRVLRLQVHEHLARKERACFLARVGNGVLAFRHAGNGHGTEALTF